MADLQDRFARLTPEQREFVLDRLRKQGALGTASASHSDSIPRIAADGSVPVSFAQQRLWFIDRYDGASAAYNMRAALHLSGPLDVPALKRAFDEIVRRHSALRTRFNTVDGVPVQDIQPARSLDLPIVDLTGWSTDARHAEVRRIIDEEPRRLFDLSMGPLIRVSLLRLSSDEYVLLSVIHHIVSDGWSLGVLIRELTALYKAYVSGEASPLPDLQVQYADYAVWQRQRLNGEGLARHIDFWSKRLSDAPPVTPLPLDRPRPAISSGLGRVELFRIDAHLTRAVSDLARMRNASLSMAFLGIFATLIARLGNNDDIMVGLPVANRDRAELEPLIGFFVNTLPLRLDLSGAPSFVELLDRTRLTMLDAFSHQELPFEKLVEELKPDRTQAHAVIVQVMFNFQSARSEALDLAGLKIEPYEMERSLSLFDLTLNMVENPDGSISCEWEYSSDLFDAETLRRFGRYFVGLTTEAVAAPERSVFRLNLLPDAERRRLIVDMKRTATDYPREATIPMLVGEQAMYRPDAPAVRDADVVLSYRELMRRANRLARWLIAQGVGAETVVAVMDARGADLIVDLLAVTIAGGAYLPIEPTTPPDRVSYLLSDSGARILLTRGPFADALNDQALSDVEVAALDRCAAGIEVFSDAPVPSRTSAANLAYINYTSGSTGQPKGIAVTHRSVVRLVRDTDYIAIGPDDRIAQVSTVAFDAATFDIWGALANGASVDIADRDISLSPAAFADWLATRGITTLFLTTALFNRVASERPAAFASLTQVLFGGEAVDPRWVRSVLAAGGPRRLLHVYGPTECTTFSTWHLVDAVMEDARTIAIGGALANTTLCILDRFLNLVPLGVTGELYVGGDALARGYVGRADLTADVFVPDPFADRPGERLYRTGDLVRRLADGAIEFVGRTDNQVKIRGFRIEPGEVETVLLAQADVAEAIVIVDDQPAIGKRLIGYVTARGDGVLTPVGLRQALKQSLPDYMIPAAIIVLPELPLTANGKIDRARLPPPGVFDDARDDFIVPDSETQQAIAEMWQTLLGQRRIGAADDFFALGGHSLLATQAVSRIRDAFGIDLPLRSFFAAANVRDVACAVDALRGNRAVESPIVRRAADTTSVLSFAQERMWFLDQLEGTLANYNMTLALDLTGDLDEGALAGAFFDIVARHEILRTALPARDGKPSVVVRADADAPFEVIDLTDLASDLRTRRLDGALAEATSRRFDLTTGPLIGLQLFRLGATRYRLLIAAHHIVADGWSLSILVREFSALYRARCMGVRADLAPLPIQYSDYAAWQRNWLDGDVRAGLIDYWIRHLAGAPPVLQLPADRPRPAILTFRGGTRPLALDADLTRKLKALAGAQGSTLFMILLAAFATLLHRYSAQDDLVIGTPVANRTRSESERLIGFFVNTLALRLDVAGRPTFLEFLDRVSRAALDGFTHQDLPFEQLVDALQPERSLSHTPLFQVMFILQNAAVEPLDLPGLTATAVAVSSDGAKYDLTLALEDGPDGLSGAIEYSADLFDPVTIDRMIDHFGILLNGIVADPAQPVTALPMLGALERARLVNDFNATDAGHPTDLCLHRMVETQIARTPDATAIIAGQTRLDYRDLNRRANAVARELIEHGVGPDVPVGIFMARSADLVVAILAVLKAGGAYVPLDPAYPADRVAFMLEDSKPAAILTDARVRASLPATDIAVLEVDTDGLEPNAPPPHVRVDANNLAYILYTSGSTGRPKGVAIQHRSASVMLNWARAVYGPEDVAGVLAATSICFDLSVFELFLPLTTGGAVIVADNVLQLPDLPARAEVTLINTVPSAIAALVRENGVPPGAHIICLAGEPLKNALVQQLYDVPTVRAVYNLYGPSEDTTYSTFVLCARGGHEPTIGRPIDDSRVYIVDATMVPTPIGIPGELYIAGQGLARGYYRRPDLTAEKFVPDPFGAPGTRLYRTGDHARWLADGSIEFLGRLDHQVKLRGFRIELDEIEATMARHPGVRECVAVVREDEPGIRRLVAYASPRGADLAADTVRTYLAEKLPAFMVPQDLIVLAELPHTPNGKIDRRALPRPDGGGQKSGRSVPRTERERILADIWADVLRIETPGIDDNFFDLGGDSIISLQVVARARQAGLALTPKQLFEHQTVARLAEAAGRAPAMTTQQGIVTGDIALTPIQQWLLGRDLAAPHHFNQAILIETPHIAAERLSAIGRAILRHHDILRARFTKSADGWRQHITAPDDLMEIGETFDLSTVASADRTHAVGEIADRIHAKFSLGDGPLIRFAQFDFGDGPAWLLIVAHHLVIDGVSWRILLEDIATLSRQSEAGEQLALPGKTTSFRDWAETLSAQATSMVLKDEASYWAACIDAEHAALPRDHAAADGMNIVSATDTVTILLDPDPTQSLSRDASASYGMRVDEVMLTALGVCLADWCDAESVLIDLELHGRETTVPGIDLSRTVGWFTVLFPVRIGGGLADPAAILKSTKECLRTVPNGGVGYGLLRYQGDTDTRDRFRNGPHAEIVFNYLGRFAETATGNLRFAAGSTGTAIGTANRRSHLLEMTAVIVSDRLKIDIAFCTAIHDRATIERLADHLRDALILLAAHCADPDAVAYTPSDFPDLDLDQSGLDRLMAVIGGAAPGNA